MITLRRKWLLAFCVLVAVPVSVRADAINVPFVVGYGLVVLGPLLAFQTAVEAAVLRFGFSMGWRDAAKVMFWANVWSVVAGIPTKFLNAWIYDAIVPRNFYDYTRTYVAGIVVGSCVYFVVTVLVEWLNVRRRLRKKEVLVSGSRLLTVVAMANVVTYAVCAPLYYQGTKPRHSIREFTANSSWAKQPTAELFYISDDTGFLRSVRTDGSGDRLVAPFKMESYVVSVDRKQCVFRGDDEKFYDLDLATMRRVEIPGKWDRWTRVGEVARLDRKQKGWDSGWFGWTEDVRWVRTAAWQAYAERGLGSSIRIAPKGGEKIWIADNPGWLHLGNRYYRTVEAVNANECLFDDGDSIYLLDIAQKRVGFVARGSRVALAEPPKVEVEATQFF